MNTRTPYRTVAAVGFAALLMITLGWVHAQERKGSLPVASSYDQIAPVLLGKESFQSVMAKDKADKPAVMARQKNLLDERYDLSPRPDKSVTMSRGKPIQVGPAARLPQGMTWEKLAAMSRRRDSRQRTVPQGLPPPAPPQAR